MELRSEKLKNRIAAVLMIVFMASLLVYAGAAMILKDAKKSAAENRKLTQFTAPDLHSVADGSWLEFFEEYSLDQCPGREQILRTYFGLMDASGIRDRSGYLRCGNDTIVDVPATSLTYSQKQIDKYVSSRSEALVKLDEVCAASGADLVYLEIPHKNSYFHEEYPVFYQNPIEKYESRRDALLSCLDEKKIDYVDAGRQLLYGHEGEYLYFQTDNHYTFLGAYYVYKELLAHLNETYGADLYYPEWDECVYKRSDEPLVGNYLKKFGDSGRIRNDYIEYAVPSDMPGYKRYDNGEKTKRKVITDDFSGFTDCFMGDNVANTVVKTKRPELPNVLIIGYSYSNALEALSVYSFNEMHSIDPRMFEGSISEYIRSNDLDYVIVVRDDLYEGNDQNKAKI